MRQIKVLGMGCAKCKKLYDLINDEIKELNIGNVEVVKVEDISCILQYNISQTPAIVFEDKVVFAGTMPTKEQIRDMLS